MATQKIEVLGYTRTLVGDYIQNTKLSGLAYEMHDYTTLNEHLGVEAGVAPEKGTYPYLKYMVIGNKGHKMIEGPDGSPTFGDYGYKCTSTRLYGHLPFIVREINNDLTPGEQEKYALRVTKVYNGTTYVLYYARRIDFSNTRAVYKQLKQKDGQKETSSFTYTTDNMKAEPPRYDSNGTLLGTEVSLFTSATVTVTLTAEEIAEIINGYRIINNTTIAPVLSEIGLCTGVDKSVPLMGTNTYYNEVIACQVNIFISVGNSLRHDNNGLRFEFDLGSSEPMTASEEQ